MRTVLVTMVMKVDSSMEPEKCVSLNNDETSVTTRHFLTFVCLTSSTGGSRGGEGVGHNFFTFMQFLEKMVKW